MLKQLILIVFIKMFVLWLNVFENSSTYSMITFNLSQLYTSYNFLYEYNIYGR